MLDTQSDPVKWLYRQMHKKDQLLRERGKSTKVTEMCPNDEESHEL